MPFMLNCGTLDSKIDIDDIESVIRYGWYINNNGYACANSHYMPGIRRRTVVLSRVLMSAPVGFHVDHIDGDKLNNCRSNLRVVTPAQNQQNRSAIGKKGNSSGWRNVILTKSGRYQVALRLNGKQLYFGAFDTLEEGKAVAVEARKKIFTHCREVVK